MRLFTMRVEDTFHLEDGRTAFVGVIKTEAKAIPSCDCEILIGDEVKATLRIDGEEISKGKKVTSRVITTSERIDLSRYGIVRGGFKIRSKD